MWTFFLHAETCVLTMKFHLQLFQLFYLGVLGPHGVAAQFFFFTLPLNLQFLNIEFLCLIPCLKALS